MTSLTDVRAGAMRPGARLAVMLVIVAAAFVLRGRYFGSPNVHVDEQFYLLMGDRLLHQGAIPYIDIWDRKPVGLFLLYAAIRMLGGDGIIQYQVVATLFAAGTAILIALWAARLAGHFAGTIGGLFYLVLLHKFSGYGGEAEVFLNFFTTAAAFVVAVRLLPSGRPEKGPGYLLLWGSVAMAVSGLAIQIKPTSVFPGAFLGLALIYLAWLAGWKIGRIAAAAVLWALLGLLPTLLVVLYYASTGHLDAFLFANVYSIGLRYSDDFLVMVNRFRSQALGIGLPVAGALLLTWLSRRGDKHGRIENRDYHLILGWLAAGFVAFLSVGTFYNNYALVVAPMACVLLGTTARPKGIGWLALGGMGAYAVYVMAADQKRASAQQAAAPQIYALADTIKQHLNGRCLYVYRGLPIFYYLTNACIPTRFAFPDHLSLVSEAPALGVDPVAEARRIIATRPGVIVFHESRSATSNEATSAVVRAALAKDYHPIASAASDRKGLRFQAFGLNADSRH